jgi:hypothetical protein
VGGFAEELHGPGTELPQGFNRYRSECISWAVVVGKVVPVLVCIPKRSGMARVADGRVVGIWGCGQLWEAEQI